MISEHTDEFSLAPSESEINVCHILLKAAVCLSWEHLDPKCRSFCAQEATAEAESSSW